MVCRGVDVVAEKSGIEKSIWSLPPPHPPIESSAAMMAAERVLGATPETSSVHGSGCSKRPPTVGAPAPPSVASAAPSGPRAPPSTTPPSPPGCAPVGGSSPAGLEASSPPPPGAASSPPVPPSAPPVPLLIDELPVDELEELLHAEARVV